MIDDWKNRYIRDKIGDNNSLYNKILDLSKNQPLSKIFKEKYFWKYKFKTNKHTLDPRSDTEMILELLHKQYDNTNNNLKILELGVGTGALIISILKDFENWNGLGIDISHNALKVARYNVKQHQIENRCILQHNDWLSNIDEKYDILISNPPYLLPSEYGQHLKMDPKLSLIEPEDLYFYKLIANKADNFKHIFLEINCKRDINDYLKLFTKYNCIIHYLNNTIPIILEIKTI